MTGNTIQEYLVGLGFEIDQAQLLRFQRTLDLVSNQVATHTAAMSRDYTAASVAIVSAFGAIAAATGGFLDQLARADLEYQKFALRMFVSIDTAKRMKIALDAMGESLEDIAWFPELRERYTEFMREQGQMGPPVDYETQMRRMRDIRNEFTRFYIIMQYGSQWVGNYLIRYLNQPIGEFQRWLIGVNDYIKEKMPEWSEKVAYALTMVINLGRSGKRSIEDLLIALSDLWKSLSGEGRQLLVVGGLVWLFSKMGPIGRATTMILGVIVAIDDFYAYMDGRKSVKELSPIWANLWKMSRDLKGTFDMLVRSVDDLFTALVPSRWEGVMEFWDNTLVRLRIVGYMAAMGALQLAAQVYRFSSDPESQAKYKEIQEQIDRLNKAAQDAYQEGGLTVEERRAKRRREEDEYRREHPSAAGTIGEREREAMNFYIEQGVTPINAAAIVGNLRQESGLDPSIVNPRSGAFGIAQWLYPSRVAAMKKFFADRGKPLTDFRTQLEFSMTEPEMMEALRNMGAANSLPEKTKIFSRIYEGAAPYEENLPARRSFADQIYQDWISNRGTASMGPTSYNMNMRDIVVQVASTNATAEEIARAVKEELLKEQAFANARMIREASGVYG